MVVFLLSSCASGVVVLLVILGASSCGLPVVVLVLCLLYLVMSRFFLAEVVRASVPRLLPALIVNLVIVCLVMFILVNLVLLMVLSRFYITTCSSSSTANSFFTRFFLSGMRIPEQFHASLSMSN